MCIFVILSIDFLPMKCDACSKIFCDSHFTYEKHHCPESYKKVNYKTSILYNFIILYILLYIYHTFLSIILFYYVHMLFLCICKFTCDTVTILYITVHLILYIILSLGELYVLRRSCSCDILTLGQPGACMPPV